MKNLGNVDRLLRAVVGVGLLGIYLATGEMWALIGIVPLATAAIGFCPVYCPLKINTASCASSNSCCSGGSCEKK